jgi:hypothetical protein
MLLTLTHQQLNIWQEVEQSCQPDYSRGTEIGRLGDNSSINKKKVACYKDFFFTVKSELNESCRCGKRHISLDNLKGNRIGGNEEEQTG